MNLLPARDLSAVASAFKDPNFRKLIKKEVADANIGKTSQEKISEVKRVRHYNIERMKMKSQFKARDPKNTGFVSNKDFTDALQAVELNFSEKDIKDACVRFGDVWKKKVDYSEFMANLIPTKASESQFDCVLTPRQHVQAIKPPRAHPSTHKAQKQVPSRPGSQTARSQRAPTPFYTLNEKAPTPEAPLSARTPVSRPASTISVASTVNSKQQLRLAVRDRINVKWGELRKAFRFFDVSHSGYITVEDLRATLKHLNVKFKPGQVERLMQYCDEDQDGKLNYLEFVGRLCKAEEEGQMEWSSQTKNANVFMGNVGYVNPNIAIVQNEDQPGVVEHVQIQRSRPGSKVSRSSSHLSMGSKPEDWFDEPVNKRSEADVGTTEVENYRKHLAEKVHTHYKLLRRAFRDADTDHSGFLTYEELLRALSFVNTGLKVDLPLVKKLARQMDEDGDGKIDYHEFARLLHAADLSEENTMDDLLIGNKNRRRR